MKFAKRTISVLLAVLMLVSILPLSVYAASLKITTQPKTSYTEYGATAKATIKATGDGLKYTWYVKNAGASKYSKSSVTKSTYSVKMTDSTKSRSVYCVVKDKKGKTVKSSTAILRMKATITTEPKTTYAKQGATAKLTVKAKGDGLKYTWYIKNAGKTKYSKSSVTKSTYSVTMSDSVHGRYVYCVVTDKYGKTDKSKTVVLRQQATITTQPVNTTVANGETAKLTVKAKGDGLTYQWYIKNAGGSKYSKSSITKSTYSVKMSDSVHGRYVYCIVTDKYGKTEKSKTVMLKLKADPLTITKQPQSTSAAKGDQVGFGIIVKGGKAPYTYELQYTYGNHATWRNDIMAGVEILKMGDMVELAFMVSFAEDYRYRIVVTDAAGKQVISNEVTVEKIANSEPLEITRQPECATASAGDEVGFGIEVTGGEAPYTYELQYSYGHHTAWFNDIMRGVEILQMGDMVEMVFTVSFDEDYRYRIVVTDAAGNEVTSDVVWVEEYVSESEPLTIEWQTPDLGTNVGDTVELAVGVAGGTEPYTYQWQYCSDSDEVWQDCQENRFPGCQTDNMSVTVDETAFSLNYHYRCIITDAEGEQVITEMIDLVELLEPFAISSQPQNTTVRVGDNAIFTVEVAGGKEPYTYKWEYKSGSFNWTAITGTWATGAQTDTLTFEVGESEFKYTYYYRCKITDAHGNVIYSDEVRVIEN